jgi:hypothetical protein
MKSREVRGFDRGDFKVVREIETEENPGISRKWRKCNQACLGRNEEESPPASTSDL